MTAAISVPIPPHKQRQIDSESSAMLQLLVASTPAQIVTWMTANAQTPAQVQKVLTALALAVRYLYQRGS